MPPEFNKLLKKAGFDDKEIAVYLAAVMLGSAPASEIAKEAKIRRSTCYGILEDLAEKGLATKTEKGKVLHFDIENIDLLKTYIVNQKQSFTKIEKDVGEFLPELKKLQKQADFRSEAEYFEGVNGIKSAFESVLPDVKKMAKKNLPLFMHGSTSKILEIWPDFPEYVKRRGKTGIKVHMLNWETMPKPMVGVATYYNVRYLPDKYTYPGGTNILEDKILLLDVDSLFAVIIKNKRLTEMMRIFFDFMWDHSK